MYYSLIFFNTIRLRSFINSNILQIEYAEKKKAEGKKMRDDRNAVQDMLFAAFEKHQYYNIRDLVKITRQPIVNIYLLFTHIFDIYMMHNIL